MNPELEAAEQQLRQTDQQTTLDDSRMDDLRMLEGIALSGFKIPLELVYALSRECVRLRRELEELKKTIGASY